MNTDWNHVKGLLLAIWIILFAIWVNTLNAADHAIGDLKSVTIQFKNDSEFKLKTQWFINACDTTKNIVWENHQYWDSAGVPYDLAELDRQGLKYEWINQEYGMIRWQQIKTAITCRQLVGVTIETHRTVKTIRNPRTGESMKVTVKPGEAIIFYEEVRQ